MVVDGEPVPDLTLTMDDGGTIALATMRGESVVLYFYPKDDTSGCTAEAKDFSCLAKEFASQGARVIGVSPDSVASHRKFRKKYELDVELASDEAKTIAQTFGVWVEKSMYGRTYMGVERSTFLIDARGVLVKSWRKVKVTGHAEEVLAAVKAMKAMHR